MAHLIRIVKVRKLKHEWEEFVEEKEIGLNEDESDFESSTDSSFSQNVQRCWLARLINEIRTPNTTANLLALSLSGFIGGVLLTYVLFIYFYVGVSFSLGTATDICGLTSIFLCLGLAFSPKVRCYILLVISALFSKQGRQTVLAYALFLAFTGPARNTIHNLGILSDSMTCGQEVIKRTLKQIFEMVRTPYKSVKETMEKLTKALKNVIETMTTYVMDIKRIIISILNVIEKATGWLENTVHICNKKMGTPFQRCMKTFDDAIVGCKAKMGGLDFVCHVTHVVKALCTTVKGFDFMCVFTEFPSEKTIAVIKRKLCVFGLRMKNVLYVSIEFTDTHHFETVAINATRERGNSFVIMIKKKIEKLQSVFGYFGFAFSLFFPFLFFKAYDYKYKYLSSDSYDNVYINRYIVDLDLKRAEMDRETVLPLEFREKERYAKTTSIRMVELEKFRFTHSMFFLTLASFKVLTFLAVDYSLFWILLTIYETGRNTMEEVDKSKLVIHVNGEGILADFYRNLGKTFQVPNINLTSLRCLRDPSQPDTRRYMHIGFLVALTWILTLTGPYGLRLRGVVMSHYYPDRARERAVWLYNHILQSRGSFLRYARRQLRRKFSGRVQPTETITLTQRLFTGSPFLDAIFGKSTENNCLLCGENGKNVPLKRCKTPDCPGRYDKKCYDILGNVCTICRLPVEYGDISDMSEEIDSSEEDLSNGKPHETHDAADSEGQKFLTFKDMELRDSFRDVEANKFPDYAKLSDLPPRKSALKQRLKEVLCRKIENARNEKKKRKVQVKQSKYKQVKCKVRDLIMNLKTKKSQEILERRSALKKKVAEKVDSLRNFKRKKSKECERLLPSDKPESSINRVTFEIYPEESETKLYYRTLKQKLKTKIQKLKERKDNSTSENSEEENELC